MKFKGDVKIMNVGGEVIATCSGDYDNMTCCLADVDRHADKVSDSRPFRAEITVHKAHRQERQVIYQYFPKRGWRAVQPFGKKNK